MRVLTATQMRTFDRWAIEVLGVPSLVLMENAAIGVVDALFDRFENLRSCIVVCGPGNNGADGYAVARHLRVRGVDVRCHQVGTIKADSDLARQRGWVVQLGIPVTDGLKRSDFRTYDVVIDALFGTGLSGPLEGPFVSAVRLINGSGRPVVSVDLPSGLDASSALIPARYDEAEEPEQSHDSANDRNEDESGEASEEHTLEGFPLNPGAVRATLTVALARPKIAHVCYPAAGLCGRVVVADLGVPFHQPLGAADPEGEVDTAHPQGERGLQTWLGEELILPLLRSRPEAGHKGTFGHALVIAGSSALSGAAVLCARAALRSGCGLVSCRVPGAAASALLGIPEVMRRVSGSESRLAFGVEDAAEILESAGEHRSLAIGPGLGRDSATGELVRLVVAGTAQPMVVDADALFALNGPESVRGRDDLILTPHPGEMARLLGWCVNDVEADRLHAVRECARRSGAVVILKGRPTVVSSPQGEVWINSTGGPMLATGGTGDVLTGLLCGLLAQGYNTLDAALVGVFVHGLCADHLSADRARLGVLASEVADEIPLAFERLYRGLDLDEYSPLGELWDH